MESVNSGWWRPRILVLAIAVVALVGCAARTVDAVFPRVTIRKRARTGSEIGLAPVRDSRANPLAGEVGNADLAVGAGLPRYIGRKFHNELVKRGFQPSTTADPADSSVRAPATVVVVTLQSVSFGSSEAEASHKSSVSIAVQVYRPPGKLIYGNSFWGTHSAAAGWFSSSIQVLTGNLIAGAADQAIEAAFADPKFEKALL